MLRDAQLSQSITYMSLLKLKIVSPERILLETEASSISLPTPLGQITILPNHVPYISVLVPGEVVVVANGQVSYYNLSGGFVQVRRGGTVNLLADAAEHISEINEDRAEVARKRAQEALRSANMSDQEYAATVAALERSLSRLKIVRKRSNRRSVPITGEGVLGE